MKVCFAITQTKILSHKGLFKGKTGYFPAIYDEHFCLWQGLNVERKWWVLKTSQWPRDPTISLPALMYCRLRVSPLHSVRICSNNQEDMAHWLAHATYPNCKAGDSQVGVDWDCRLPSKLSVCILRGQLQFRLHEPLMGSGHRDSMRFLPMWLSISEEVVSNLRLAGGSLWALRLPPPPKTDISDPPRLPLHNSLPIQTDSQHACQTQRNRSDANHA